MRLVRFFGVLLFLLLLWFKLPAQERISILERRVSCQIDSANVEQILEKLVLENDLFFSYNPEILPKGKRNARFSNASLIEVLANLLPANEYKMEILDNQVIIMLVEVSSVRLSGMIVEGRKDTPVPFATLTISGESIGTMTNINGQYDLNIPWRFHDRLISVRCLGFKPLEIIQNDLKNHLIIRMELLSVHLHEIEVKPVIVAEVLKGFREKIEKNYERSAQLMITFYRETIKRDNQYIGVWEAVMEMLKSPYNSEGSDRVRFLKGRKSNFNKTFNDIRLKIQGGPWYITTLDIVRNLETFLDPKFEHLYRYRFEQPEMYNGRITWVIRFSRKEDVDYPCYFGKILIDADSYALVNAEFGLDKKSLKLNGETFIKKEPHGIITRPERAEYAVNYRMVEGRWQFYSARTDVIFQVKQNKGNLKTEYRSVSDVLVTQQYHFPSRARFGPEGLFNADDIFADIKGDYDPEFWGNYNVIKPDEDLNKALREIQTEAK
ncbi:MAG: carboxypeptidase-like regulatory domain-containing protein [Mariniphaga sp.]